MAFEPREFPAQTITGLVPPKAGFPYFQNAERFPFQPAAVGYSPINAWWLADASLLVYGDADFIEDALRQSPLPGLGFALEWLGTREDNRGFILHNGPLLIVTFRGTRVVVNDLTDLMTLNLIHQADLVTDMALLPVGFQAGGLVHSGFLKAFLEVSGQLDQRTKAGSTGQTVWLTGHSLGGALATLAAAHLGGDFVQGLYSFGSPRVGNADFARILPNRSHFRLVHRDDWVVTQPPEFLGYVHAGELKDVTGDPDETVGEWFQNGMLALTSALKTMADVLNGGDVGNLPFTLRGVADHAPIMYATLLWNALRIADDPPG